MIRFRRIGYRIALPNATALTLHMSSDGKDTAVTQATVTKNGAVSTTSLTKAAGVAFVEANDKGAVVRCVTATIAGNVGLTRKVTAFVGANEITVNAFPNNMTAADTFVLEREVKTVRRVRLTVESGGHLHYSPRPEEDEGLALVTDPYIDDTLIKELSFPDGITALNILTDTDVSALYVNVEAD